MNFKINSMKKIFILFLIMVLFSCADVEESREKLCVGITCSNHGRCINNYTKNIPECKCDSGYISVGAECIIDCSLIENSSPNIYNTKCICDSGYDSIIVENNLTCKRTRCKSGYTKINGECIYDCRYKDHAHPDGDMCKCDDGYERINEYCVFICEEENNLVTNSNNDACICKESTFLGKVENLCIDPCLENKCSENRDCVGVKYNDYRCNCKFGLSLSTKLSKNLTEDFRNNREMKLYKLNNNEKVLVWTRNELINEVENKTVDYTYLEILNSDNSKKRLIKIGNDKFNKVQPDLAVGPENMLVAWRDRRHFIPNVPNNLGDDIYIQKISFEGDLLDELRVTPEGESLTRAFYPKVVWNPEMSTYGIFWQEIVDGHRVIKYASYNNQIISSRVTISNTEKNSYDFDVVVTNSNEYAIVWSGQNERNSRIIYFKVLNPDGTVKIETKKVTYSNTTATNPKIKKRENHYDIFYKSSSRIYMTQFNFKGVKIIDKFLVSNQRNITTYNPIWQGNEYYIILNNSSRKIYLSIADKFGHPVSSKELISYGYAENVFATEDNSFVWRDKREGIYNIYINQVDCY